MFNRNKYIYTCPDVIHWRARQKKTFITNLVVSTLLVIGVNVWAWRGISEMDKELEAEPETPTE